MTRPLRVLMVEDSEDDALLVELALRRGGYAPDLQRVDALDGLREALSRDRFDVVISDWALPRMNGLDALRVVRESAPELPFVLVSGTIGEDLAVLALKEGAGDFVTKQNLTRLAPAVEREIADAQVRLEKRRAHAQLEQAVAARDTFLSIASHELKTPLTSLQLQLQSLVRAVESGGAGTDRVSQKIRSLARSTHKMGELVNRLLDVSRITSGGGIELVREEFDLAELAAEVVARFREVAAESGSEVVLRLEPVRGSWDRMRVDSIVTNLLSNALKYGEGRPVEVHVRPEGARAILEVRDHGIGIAPDDQARIFERFERAVPERHYGGFGIGLWVARQVAEEHGGGVRVASDPGRGSTFTLELPRDERGARG